MRISDWSSDVCSSDLPAISRSLPGSCLPDLLRQVQRLRVQLPEIVADNHFRRVRSRLQRSQELRIGRCLAERIKQLRLDFRRQTSRSNEAALGTLDEVSSEERRVGKEGVRTVRFGWSPYI